MCFSILANFLPVVVSLIYGDGNTETRTWAGVDEIDLDGSAGAEKTFLNQEFQRIILVYVIIFLWLIQSQSQRGPCSATLHKGYTERRINISYNFV